MGVGTQDVSQGFVLGVPANGNVGEYLPCRETLHVQKDSITVHPLPAPDPVSNYTHRRKLLEQRHSNT